MLAKLGEWIAVRVKVGPWSLQFGIARSLLACGSLLTLLFSQSDRLFIPAERGGPPPNCEGIRLAGLHCMTGGNETLTALISIFILLWVLSGFLPAFSALPHAWIAFSLASGLSIPEGGDQIAQILTLLILPAALTDRRMWHWKQPTGDRCAEVKLLAWSGIWIVSLQATVIYLQAAFSKLAVTEWVEGTALYYWVNSPSFGSSGWIRDFLNWLFSSGYIAAGAAWSAIGLEIVLGLAILYKRKVKNFIFLLGVGFHISIALIMGLVSFMFPMVALLVLYLIDLRPRTLTYQASIKIVTKEIKNSDTGPLPVDV